MKIFIAGHVCVDRNTIKGVQSNSWGSTAMYISHFLKNYDDVSTTIFAPYGADYYEFLEGVNIINDSDGLKTMVYENVVVDGERSQACHQHADLKLPSVTDEVIGVIDAADILICAPMTSNYPVKYVKEMLSNTKSTGLKVLLPQGYMREISASGKVSPTLYKNDEFFQQFDVVVVSDVDVQNKLRTIRAWSEKNPQVLFVVTQAEKGASFYWEGVPTQVRTNPIPFNEITNPVGSGDVFSAILSMKLAQGLDPYEAVDAANIMMAKYLKD